MRSAARSIGVLVLLVLCLGLWYTVASDYGDSVVSGKYRLAQDGEMSTLVLKADHSFQQDLIRSGRAEHAEGTWRRIGEGGIAFSKEFLLLSGQEPGADGTAYGDIHKDFGLLVSITLSQYDVLWYGRVDPAPDNSLSGTYAGDEPGVPATLIVKPDHTFEQTVTHPGVVNRVSGSWSLNKNGDIVFSQQFLKTSGESLKGNETASAWNPKGSNLQIQIAVNSKSGEPTFRKKQFLW
jgi:hypothetical protein